MSYKKTVWEDFVTPLDENNMNNIENGIEHVDQELHKTQEDLRQTKKHLDQTDINVATNKQAIIDLETKHDEDIQNLDDKYTKEINDTNAEVATKLPKQNIDILKDVNIEVSGDQAFITKTTVNLNEDTLEPVEQSATQIIPDATEQQSGLMTKATVKAINQMQEQIEQLQGKTTRLLYTDKTDPTAAEINAFVIAEGYTEPFDGIAVVVDETYHIWHFYEGGVGWKDDGLDTVTTFTNDIAGIIKGSNDDGKVYANEDGTGSVKGWDTVKQDIASNAQAITQRATLTQLAATNQNLTNLTNHVDDVEEQLQQNITNGDNALDAKITNLNNKTLQLPTTIPTKQVVVTITTGNVQQNLTTDSFVMTTPQTLTAAQKLQARVNLDLPTTLFDGSYTSLSNKPILNTDNSIALTTNAAEEINGIMNLHKISKTGTSTDLVDSADLARQAQITTLTENVEILQTQIDNKFDKTGGTITGDTNIVNGRGLVLTPASAGSTYCAFKFYAQGDDVFVEKQKVEGGADYQKLLPLDSSLSTTSENAVQNRVVSSVINTIQETLNNKTTVNINNVLQSTINFDSDPQTQIDARVKTSDLLNLVYPVGSIYMSVNSTNPSTLFGGTWEQFAQGRVLLGVGSNGETDYTTAEQTGGSENSVASHTHTQQEHNHTQQAHNHTLLSNTGIDGNANGFGKNDKIYGISGVWQNSAPDYQYYNVDNAGHYYVKSTRAKNNPTTAVNNSTGEVGGNRMPFITCYIWKRTA